MTETIVILLCAAACGYFKGKADTIAFTPEYALNGWKGKWRLLDKQPVKAKLGIGYGVIEWESRKYHWWYFGLYYPPYFEKYIFSSTLFVFASDHWHLYQWLSHRAQEIMVVAATGWNWWWMLIIAVLRGLFFNITFRKK